MYSIDKDNFKSYLLRFPQQINESKKIFESSGVHIDKLKIENIIFLGMGGSAIAGDVFRATFFDELKYPLQVARGYQCPGYCSEKSLVIVSSYSGDTEETIAAARQAVEYGGQIVAIASGGKIEQMARDHSWPLIKIPGGLPPRQAFGYSFFPLLHLLNPLLGKPVKDKQIDAVLDLVNALIQRNDEKTSSGKSLAKELAIKAHHRIPIIYSSAPYLESVALRWKNQFQENSKSLAFHNVIPEMNHNEIVGWEMENKCVDNFIVFFLEGMNIHPRVKARIELTKNIIHGQGAEIVSLYTEGATRLEQVISLICKGDWVTYYLALLYEKNPAAILNIDFLKTELEKMPRDL
jgi:glucose/mannose-6-phosphate isomerase